MPKLIILPHPELCPDGAALEGATGETILDIALRNGIEIEHACEKSCAVLPATAWCGKGRLPRAERRAGRRHAGQGVGLEPESRLSCQARLADEDLVVELPKYTLNLASERH